LDVLRRHFEVRDETVTVNGVALPDTVVGKPEMQVTLEAGLAFRPAAGPRELGLAFGVFELR
jgi:hypothetical protein